MKKLFYLLILIFLGFFAWNIFGRLSGTNTGSVFSLPKAPKLADIKKDVSTPGALRSQTQKNGETYLTRAGTIAETNKQRLAQGLKSLKEDYALNQAAQKKLKDMFQNQYFEHISPTGQGPADLAKDVGYEFIAVGENLALGNYKNDAGLVEAWMNSPGHKANILNLKFTEIGVAVGKGMFEGQETWLAVQEFGKPASSCPKVDATLKDIIQSHKSELLGLESQVLSAKTQMETLATDLKSKEDYNLYNQKVSEYNAIVRLYNNKLDNLKTLTEQYNSQVNAYNACLN